MEANERISGNRLIAEFMGIETKQKNLYHNPPFHSSMAFSAAALEYHKSWDWLMPVVDKIEELENYNFHVFIGKRYTRIIYDWDFYQKIGDIDKSTDLKAHYEKTKTASKDYRHSIFDNDKKYSTFTAVVDFITWYKLQPKP